MAKISVIVPVYQVEKYLKQCLDSILNQTLKDIEVILVNDGSKDKCPEIIDEYAKKDNRIIPLHKKNGGWGSACNAGLDIAGGEYIAIVEPDDYISRFMYEKLYNIAKQNNCDIVKSCFYENLQFENKFICKKPKWDTNKIPDLPFNLSLCPVFLSYHPSIWSCIYKKTFLNKNNIRFFEAPGACWGDNLFQVQTLVNAKKISYTNEAFYYWRKLNECPQDDLRDYTIPFETILQVHNWLENNKINDKNVLFALGAREISYINIALAKANLNEHRKVKILVNSALEKVSTDSSNKKLLKEFNEIKNHLLRKMIFIKLKNFKKKLLSLRLQENRITIFKKTFIFKEIKNE